MKNFQTEAQKLIKLATHSELRGLPSIPQSRKARTTLQKKNQNSSTMPTN